MSVVYCFHCDRQWDSDYHETCPSCDRDIEDCENPDHEKEPEND